MKCTVPTVLSLFGQAMLHHSKSMILFDVLNEFKVELVVQPNGLGIVRQYL